MLSLSNTLEPCGLYNHGMQLAECIRKSSIKARAVYKYKFVCRQILYPLHLTWRQMWLSMQMSQWAVVSDNVGAFAIQVRSPFLYSNYDG